MEAAATIVLIVASFIFSSWLGRRILRRVTKSGVLEEGNPATAVILSMAETGTTVNEHPMVEFELEITPTDGEPYMATVKQVMPRLMLGTVRPGISIGVRVMPDDPSKVALDWKSLGAKDAGPTLVPASKVVDNDEFLLTAIPARAEIDSMSETKNTVKNPRTGIENQVFKFSLTVQREGQPPYKAELWQGVPVEHKGTFGPGATIPIGINPTDPSHVGINWTELERERRSAG